MMIKIASGTVHNIFVRAAKPIPLVLAVMGYPLLSYATPFNVYDGRSAAMAGIGVATNALNSAYVNPALLGSHVESYDAVIMAPVYGQSTADPDELEKGLDDLRGAIQSSNNSAIQSQLAALKGDVYKQDTIRSASLIVPSTILGGCVFVNSYSYNNARTVIGPDDFTTTPPTYVSTLEHRAVKVTEVGVGAGSILDWSNGFWGGLQIGVAAKIMLLQNFGYSEPINTASLGLDDAQVKRDSMFNFDLGVMREFGVWKVGVVARNILSKEFNYGSSTNTYKIGPQLRIGFAYQSRRTLMEIDTDLTKNQAIGFGEDSAGVSLGWEYQLYSTVYVRAGARQNIVGDKMATGTFGVGLGIWGVSLDLGVASSSTEKSAFANFTFEI